MKESPIRLGGILKSMRASEQEFMELQDLGRSWHSALAGDPNYSTEEVRIIRLRFTVTDNFLDLPAEPATATVRTVTALA